jgi:hypothetical protein
MSDIQIKGWLQPKTLTIEQVEAESMPTAEMIVERNAFTPDMPMPEVPFMFINAEWEKLKAKFQPGDVWQRFCSDDHSWEHLFGRKGYALVRSGEVVDYIVTELN